MLQKLIPFTTKWYNRMKADPFIVKYMNCLPSLNNHNLNTIEYTLPESDIINQGLYKNNSKRYNRKNRPYTKQEDVEQSLGLLEDLKVSMELGVEPFGIEIGIDWSGLPFSVTPQGGWLPHSRLNRKQQQIQNLCRPVLKLAKEGDTIVDFCSGGGHLGILIAYLLPRCTIILLENKEQSLNVAKERVQKMNLENVKFCQCNLNYFKEDFDIGMSLHACGVATDLVIQRCIKKNAIFVSCPCCYGSLQDSYPLITYPRSEIFKRYINNEEYAVLYHAADQTHDEKNVKTKQGYKCMAIIDTDRKLYAEQFDYIVNFTKLIPETCTPKNNLLVGVPKAELVRRNVYRNKPL